MYTYCVVAECYDYGNDSVCVCVCVCVCCPCVADAGQGVYMNTMPDLNAIDSSKVLTDLHDSEGILVLWEKVVLKSY